MRSSRTVPFRALSVLALALAAVVLVAGISPGASKYLTKKKALKLFYSKAKADQRFLTSGELGETVEGWHEVGAAGQPGFATAPGCEPGNCYQNLGVPYDTVGFYKDPFGVVRLKGVARCIAPGGCNSVEEILIFTLPEGYRPPAQVIHIAFVSITPPGQAWLSVRSTGQVEVGFSLPELSSVSLDGITFRAA